MSSRRKKRYRVRYDRIFGAAAVLIVLMILLVSCGKSCGKDNKKKDNDPAIIPTLAGNEKENAGQGGEDASDTTGNTEPTSDMNFSTESVMPNQIYAGNLIVVNKEHEYSFPATPEDADIAPVYETKSESYQVQDYEVSLTQETTSALNSMMDDYYASAGNTDIMLILGYRSKEFQDQIGDSEVPGGYSDYHTGLSFDLGIFPEGENSSIYVPEGEYEWIDQNCAKYGFVLRYPEGKENKTGFDAETEHFRYVGVPHALYMKEKGLCLEEYIEELKNHPSDGEHLITSDGTKSYEVYYVPADPSANTDVPVPQDKDYTISGNNIDGFIITAEF
ncbi:MAG: M15 family metallopeptidase [Clostridium sp.]|nr:M15 family metallopeptidase [Clostridium sp.]